MKPLDYETPLPSGRTRPPGYDRFFRIGLTIGVFAAVPACFLAFPFEAGRIGAVLAPFSVVFARVVDAPLFGIMIGLGQWPIFGGVAGWCIDRRATRALLAVAVVYACACVVALMIYAGLIR